MLDSALYFQQKALASRTGELGHLLTPFARAVTLMRLGIIQKRLGNNMEALNYYKQALEVTYTSGDVVNRARAQYQVAELYENKNSPDSSLHYAQLSFANAQKSADRKSLLSVSGLLIKLYISKGRIDLVLKNFISSNCLPLPSSNGFNKSNNARKKLSKNRSGIKIK
jgi:tetratricopeptide (TPR) repeat protein